MVFLGTYPSEMCSDTRGDATIHPWSMQSVSLQVFNLTYLFAHFCRKVMKILFIPFSSLLLICKWYLALTDHQFKNVDNRYGFCLICIDFYSDFFRLIQRCQLHTAHVNEAAVPNKKNISSVHGLIVFYKIVTEESGDALRLSVSGKNCCRPMTNW